MNMSISAVPSAAPNTPSTSQAGSAGGASGGLGFAGMLVQTIGGGDAQATTSGNNGTPIPLGLTGLLAQLGVKETDGQPADLMAMLAKLIEQLQQAEQGEELSDDATGSLAEMLIAFQGVLQQIGLIQLGNANDADAASVAQIGRNFTPAEGAKPSQVVAGALKQTLQQIAALLAQHGDEINAASPSLAGELKIMLNALNDQLASTNANANANAQTATDAGKTKAADQTAEVAANAKAGENVAQKDAANQTIVVTTDAKRVATPRDPVWRFQVVGQAGENVSADGRNANVAPVTAGEEAPETGSQPAWTLLQHDATKGMPDIAQAKAALPTQVPVQQFAQQMDKFLVKQFLLAQANGTTEAKISLTPEHLGQVDIRIVMHNGQLTAQFMTTNAMAKDMIENQMAQLRASLSAQGLQVDRLEVVQQPTTSDGTAFLHQEHRQQGSSGRNGHGDGGKGGTYDEPLGFEDELERTASLREVGYGSSLNVTA